jgi:hypothetical protein
MQKKNKTAGSAKKDLKAKLSDQLHNVLAEFKEMVHEKKLQKLVKKAAKLLADGLHHNKQTPKTVNKKAGAQSKATADPEKKAVAKKTALKKTVSKKAAKKK